VSKISSADIEKLSELLRKELKLYEQIRKLTENQTQLLAKDDIDALNTSLSEREACIGKIKGLHQDSNPLMQSYVSFSMGGKDGNSEIDDLKKQIREILESCNEQNDKNIATMRDKTQEHSKKIDAQSAKRKGIGGYAQSVPNTPEVFDKKT